MNKLKFNRDLPFSISFERITESQNNKLVKMPDNSTKISQEIINDICEIRGIIINHVVNIETLMDFIIAAHFSSNVDEMLNFKKIILSKSQVVLMLKFKILRDLLDDLYFPENYDKKEFKQNLHLVIETRDDFAHGEIKIDIATTKPFLEFFRGDIKKREITQKYLDELKTHIESVNNCLVLIYSELSKKFEKVQN